MILAEKLVSKRKRPGSHDLAITAVLIVLCWLLGVVGLLFGNG
jgi:hypothetical protein